jgi:HPt (histidine-containing phosphotransfer) domain-containing protein
MRLAHTIKGSAGNFNARDTMRAAERLEASAEKGDFSRAREAMCMLQEEMERLDHVLNCSRGTTVP